MIGPQDAKRVSFDRSRLMFQPSRTLRRAGVLAALLATSTALVAQERKSDSLFTVEKFLDFEQVADPQIAPDGSQIIYARRHVNKLEDRFDAELWIMNADGTKNRFLAKGGGARWSPDGSRIAYVDSGAPRGMQLFVRWMDAEGATSQVTRVDQGIADIRWSPDGKSIGFSMLVPMERAWHIDMPAAPQGAHWTPPPKYENTLHYRQDRVGFTKPGYLHLFVVSADGGTPREITKGEWSVGARFDGQVGAVGWDWMPDGRTIVVAAIDDPNPDLVYRNSSILSIDVATGAKRRLTSQTGAWNDPVVSPDGRKIAFSGYPSMKASYQASEIYVMNVDGSGTQKITTLDRDPSGIIWARDGSGVYVSVAREGTSNLYFAPAAGGAATAVTTGTHVLAASSISRTGIGAAVSTSFTEPPNVVRVDVARRGAPNTTQLTHINEDLLARLRLATLERIVARSTNNTEVEGWIVKPANFDPSKKYPLVFEIHGGPHGMYNVAFNPVYQNFAANNFVVLYTNPRGSTGYGSAFGNAIYHNYPGPDYDDLMAAVDATVAKGYIDTDRMYVGGCSGGGVLSSWVIGHTDRFAAAAVRCPVIDWLSFAGHTDIPLFTYAWFEKPFWEDPKPWLDHSSLMYVGNVKTPTLLMTGELDMRTPIPQTEEYYAALKMRGVPAALLRFEGEYHGTGSKPTNWMRTQLYMMSWYNQWTKKGAIQAGRPVP
jgi:dipeptidyl aminopeptidase/acylaminoacyl peptidase